MRNFVAHRSSLIANCLLAILLLFFALYPVPLTLNPAFAVTQEETAVYNISNGTLPSTIVEEAPKDAGKIKSFFDSIGDLLSKVFFNPPQDKTKYYSQSEKVSIGDTPPQLKPAGENFFDNLQGFVGKNTGFYSVNLPPGPQSDEKISDYEKSFENSYFPEGISPVTGQ